MTTIFNLTQHQPTNTQVSLGVLPPVEGCKALLDFKSLPSQETIKERASALVELVVAVAPKGASVMVGGAPYLMPGLCQALKQEGFIPLFSFTERRSVETNLPDGSISKTAIFEHVGWVEA